MLVRYNIEANDGQQNTRHLSNRRYEQEYLNFYRQLFSYFYYNIHLLNGDSFE